MKNSKTFALVGLLALAAGPTACNRDSGSSESKPSSPQAAPSKPAGQQLDTAPPVALASVTLRVLGMS